MRTNKRLVNTLSDAQTARAEALGMRGKSTEQKNIFSTFASEQLLKVEPRRMEQLTLQTTARWPTNHRPCKPRTRVAEHAAATDEADKLERSHRQILWGIDTDYLTAHRKPSRRNEPTSGCNRSDCDYRLKRRTEVPFPDSLPRTYELQRQTERTHGAHLTILARAAIGTDRRCEQTFCRKPTEWHERPRRLDGQASRKASN